MEMRRLQSVPVECPMCGKPGAVLRDDFGVDQVLCQACLEEILKKSEWDYRGHQIGYLIDQSEECSRWFVCKPDGCGVWCSPRC